MVQVTYHVTSQRNIILKHVKDDEFFMCAKFRLGSVPYAEVIGNELFSTKSQQKLDCVLFSVARATMSSRTHHARRH